MAKVTFRLPSKVQFGYVEITGEPGEILGDVELTDAHGVAQRYIEYVTAYKRSEAGTVAAASPQAPAPTVEELLRDELGAREISSTPAVKPWENKPATEAKADNKPWASKATPAADDWDI